MMMNYRDCAGENVRFNQAMQIFDGGMESATHGIVNFLGAINRSSNADLMTLKYVNVLVPEQRQITLHPERASFACRTQCLSGKSAGCIVPGGALQEWFATMENYLKMRFFGVSYQDSNHSLK
jgi:hypothetical protein